MDLDRSVFWDIDRLAGATGWAHGFMAAFALWGGLLGLVLIWVAGWFVARRRDDGCRTVARVLLTAVATLIALGIGQIIASLVDRPRPFVAMRGVLLLLEHSTDPGFPSDHAVIAGAFAGGLLVISRRWCGLAVVVAVFLAFARVYVGVHYPTDVIVGLLVGSLVGIALVASPAATYLARPLAAVARTPLRPLLVADGSR